MSIVNRNSKWIWTAGPYDRDSASFVYFRKEIHLEQKVQSAVLRISADSRYRLYVNGISIVQGPCKGDDQAWFYDELEIGTALRTGVNVFAAVVLRYPQQHERGNHSVWRTDMPGLYLDGTILLEGGNEFSIEADETWKSFYEDRVQLGQANPYFDPLYIVETAEGNIRTWGWKQPGFDDHDWAGTRVYLNNQVRKAISPGGMTRRPIPFLYEKPSRFKSVICARTPHTSTDEWEKLIEGQSDVTIPPYTKSVVEISAGLETTGFLETAFAGGENAKVSILSAEAYVYPRKDQNGHIPTPAKGDRTDYTHGYLEGTPDLYRVGGFGTIERPEKYEPFWFRTFRFIQITVETEEEPLIFTGLGFRETGYPLEVQTKVVTSDESLKAIWEISERTLRLCMHETYEDCPYYEQLQYAMDSRSQILFTYNIAADDRLARKCMDDFFRSQRYDGLINSCYPSTGPNVIPGFAVYYILMIHDHMMYFGDKKLVEKYMPSIERVLQFFDQRLDETGLTARTSEGGMGNPYWSFVDWVAEWNTGVPNAIYQGPVTFDSLLYRMGLLAAAELAGYVDRPDLAANLLLKAEGIKRAVLAHCVGRDGLIQDGPGIDEYSQHAQVFGILTDVVSGSEAAKLMELALTDAALAPCSVAMAYYLFRAVEKVGLYHQTDELWTLWRQMLANNLTTCVEDSVSERSDCHAWGALILYELPAIVLGVQPAEPGYASIQVRPTPGYLTWAKGEVVTPKGLVKVKWEKAEDGSIDLKVETPEGIKYVC
ncbi:MULTISPECIES: alpha-L-rhamnosidase-related protein [Paenibacillus]|uniref:alpha-L-rhamnosidase-related protein n=1 Tax=Paenibacillus TaxID=44249 RepID=UPI0015C316F9|nr:alpha-L-rhamnosidase C-terminal domain-containing protein [Paenibacillus peoriae]